MTEAVEVTVKDLITKIDVYPLNRERLLARVRIHLGDYFIISCFLRQGSKGPFLSFPGHRNTKEDRWEDDVQLTSGAVRQEVTQLVMEAYNQKKSQPAPTTSSKTEDELPF